MRRLFFYLIIVKKAFLLSVYPLFIGRGRFFSHIRKSIENYLIFQPSRLRAKKIKRGLLKKINPQRFINSEGIKLYGWFIKPKNKMPVILHLHGQAESILTHQDIAMYCLEKGFGLFMLSYRGHYKSGGRASEQGVYNDAQAAIQRLKNLGVDEDKIIVWGHSLGSVVALETAVNNDLLGVILQSPIKEIKSAAIDVSKFYYGRVHMSSMAQLAEDFINKMDFIQKMNGIEKIINVDCPILIAHSKTDRIAPYTNSVELAKQNEKVQLFISETGTHWDANWCLDRVFEFTQSLEYNKRVKNKVKKKSESING